MQQQLEGGVYRRSVGSSARNAEDEPPTQEEYDAMNSHQQVGIKRRFPLRFPKNPERWTCPDCGKGMLWVKRKMHQEKWCKKNK